MGKPERSADGRTAKPRTSGPTRRRFLLGGLGLAGALVVGWGLTRYVFEFAWQPPLWWPLAWIRAGSSPTRALVLANATSPIICRL